MKNLFKVALLSAGVFTASQSFAQHHEPVTKKVGHAAEDVGHKTSEVSVKGAVAITGRRYEGHWAPTGELIYIDKHSRYYYVDKRGHYQYLKKWQLRTKPYKH
jgi:4-hydroxyphenylpyruvate dioxygenase-like putative hemolysin